MADSRSSRSKKEREAFSNGVGNVLDKIENPSIGNLLATPGRALSDRMALIRSTQYKVDKPILKAFALDMLGVLSSWLNDPEVLCCLIHGIFAAYIGSEDQKNLDRINEGYKLADTGFGKFLDSMIVFVDFVIVMLTQDIKKLAIMIPDIIKEVFGMIMGVVLLILQETLYAFRDSQIKVIFDWMDEWDTNQTWAKCLPLKDMINILKKYVHDYGMLAKLLNKINAFASGLSSAWKAKQKATEQVKDLEFLYWLRDLLIKLKKASLNFDLCVDYEFVAAAVDPLAEDDPNTVYNREKGSLSNLDDPKYDNAGDPNEQQGYTIGDNGDVIVDADKKTKGNYLPQISNSFIREFVHSNYSIPYEVIDNTITRGLAGDHIQGTNVTSRYPEDIISRCAHTPTSEETLGFIFNLRNRTT